MNLEDVAKEVIATFKVKLRNRDYEEKLMAIQYLQKEIIKYKMNIKHHNETRQVARRGYEG